VRKDNDPTRDLKLAGIVRAIRNLEHAGVAVKDEYHNPEPLALTGTMFVRIRGPCNR
jgi:hypothetical protein